MFTAASLTARRYLFSKHTHHIHHNFAMLKTKIGKEQITKTTTLQKLIPLSQKNAQHKINEAQAALQDIYETTDRILSINAEQTYNYK